MLATAASSLVPALTSYRGDNIATEPANVAPALAARSLDALAHYDACARGCARCGLACPTDQLDPARVASLSRSYPIRIQRTGEGLLRLDTRCVALTDIGGDLVLVSCGNATYWRLGDDGTLGAAIGSCFDVLFTGEVVAGGCTGIGAGGRMFFDDEGHLWSGTPPAPSSDMALAHLYCLRDAGGRPRAGLCGAASAPIWSFLPIAVQ